MTYKNEGELSNLQFLNSEEYKEGFPGENLRDILEKYASETPDKVLFYFLEDGFNEKEHITYAQMSSLAKNMAARLLTKYEKGDRLLMLFPPGIEFIVGLFTCFYAGIIAVPAYPPRKNRMFSRFEAIINDCQPAAILTTRKIYEDIYKNFLRKDVFKEVAFIIYEEILSEDVIHYNDPGIETDDIVLLQYTSGSTGRPNGVILNHKNILYNSEFIRQAFGHKKGLKTVHWLPAFHDMGLIGGIIQPFYMHGANIIIPPNSFLSRPMSWPRAVSKYKANTSGGPNFSFNYCVERMNTEELEGIDLSGVRPFYCGAEPIRKDTLVKFAEAYKDYNFNSDQFYPCYGLAESTLIVSGGELYDEPKYLTVDALELEKGYIKEVENEDNSSRTFVGCGFPWAGTKIAIVEPESKEIHPPGKIGEIWVSGPSVAMGYWNNPELSEKTFQAVTKDGQGPFLRTGDLGFIHDFQLYVTGRMKDLIIIRGLNYSPEDIEFTAISSHDTLQSGAGAAFSVDAEHEEVLVFVCEVKRAAMRDLVAEEVMEAIRQSISENHQIRVSAIALLRPGSIPKTSSGKIQRHAARKEFLANELDILVKWEVNPEVYASPGSGHPTGTVNQWIKVWMGKELHIDPASIDENKPVSVYGMDSMKTVILARDAEDYFGVEFPLDLLMEATTVAKIAELGRRFLKEKE